MGILSSSSKTKILDNITLNFDNVVSVFISEVLFINPNDSNSLLKGYVVKATTDFGLEFDLFEDKESGVKDRCVKFISDNWKKGKEVEGLNLWLDFDKMIGSRITQEFLPNDKEPLKLDYVAKLFAFNSLGTSWCVATYVRPKGLDNNINKLEEVRLKILK